MWLTMARLWASKNEYAWGWGELPGLRGPSWPHQVPLYSASAVPTHPLSPRTELWEILPFAPIFQKANLIINLKWRWTFLCVDRVGHLQNLHHKTGFKIVTWVSSRHGCRCVCDIPFPSERHCRLWPQRAPEPGRTRDSGERRRDSQSCGRSSSPWRHQSRNARLQRWASPFFTRVLEYKSDQWAQRCGSKRHYWAVYFKLGRYSCLWKLKGSKWGFWKAKRTQIVEPNAFAILPHSGFRTVGRLFKLSVSCFLFLQKWLSNSFLTWQDECEN